MNAENFIGIYKNAYSKEYCKKAIQLFEEADKMLLTSSRQQKEGSPKTQKDDSALFLDPIETFNLNHSNLIASEFNNVFWQSLYPHYSAQYDVLKIHAGHNIYGMKLQRTKIGGGYHIWHAEAMDKSTCNRLMAYILYLNDVEEGGETEFLYYPKRIKPEAGTLLLFPASYTHTHRGNPPLSESKYIITGWVEF